MAISESKRGAILDFETKPTQSLVSKLEDYSLEILHFRQRDGLKIYIMVYEFPIFCILMFANFNKLLLAFNIMLVK